MHASNARHRPHLSDDLRAHHQSFGRHTLVRHTLESAHDVVRHMHTGYLTAHVLEGAQRPDWPDAGQDEALPIQSQIADLSHPVCKQADIEDELRLDELSPRGDLL